MGKARRAAAWDPARMRVNRVGRAVWADTGEFVKGVRPPPEASGVASIVDPEELRRTVDPNRYRAPEVVAELAAEGVIAPPAVEPPPAGEVIPAAVDHLETVEEVPPAPPPAQEENPPAEPPPPPPEFQPPPAADPTVQPPEPGAAEVEELEDDDADDDDDADELSTSPSSSADVWVPQGPPHSRCHRCASNGVPCPCCGGKVYPEVKPEEAAAYAAMLEPMIVRAARHPVPFTPEERGRFVMAIKMSAERRAGFLSAYSDLILLGASVAMPIMARKEAPAASCACGAAIVNGYKFCAGCGASLAGECVTKCMGDRGANVPRGAKHCPNCGASQVRAA